MENLNDEYRTIYSDMMKQSMDRFIEREEKRKRTNNNFSDKNENGNKNENPNETEVHPAIKYGAALLAGSAVFYLL